MEAFTNFEKAPDLTKRGYRLDRMALLLQCFDNPQSSCRTIHIAGSKGKGSTAAFTAAILREAGFRTGVYASPHISDYRERMTINGDFAPEEVYIRNMDLIRELIEGDEYLSLPGGSEPTTFELLTLLAFLVFKEMECQWIVLETGLGGRLDATNLCDPDLVLLTPIELEHTDLLGDTIEQIAGEKAGIIKKNIPVVSSAQKEDALSVFRKKADEMKAPFFYLPDLIDTLTCHSGSQGNSISIMWKDSKSNQGNLQLLGEHQAQNCSLAIAGIRLVLPEMDDSTINKGMARAFLPGRLEMIEGTPPFLIDSAHTRDSVTRTMGTFYELFEEKGILIFGSVSGKDSQAMADVLADQFKHVIISRPGTFKKSDPQGVFELFKERNENTQLIIDPAEAEQEARKLSEGKRPILVTGSFYMASEIRNILK